MNGAAPPHDLALVTAGAEWRLRSNWSLMGRFDGEFGDGAADLHRHRPRALRVVDERIAATER